MQAVFSQVEDRNPPQILVGNFKRSSRVTSVQCLKCRQAVQENDAFVFKIAGIAHHVHVYLVWSQQFKSLVEFDSSPIETQTSV